MVGYALFFVFGLCVGSFLNVLIDRIPNQESIWKGRSHCDHCKKALHWFDLIPVLSWFMLRGRCRFCHSPISIQYPLVELTTGISFVIIAIWGFRGIGEVKILDFRNIGLLDYWFIGLLVYSYWLWITSALIVIFVTDVKYGIIPDAVVFPTVGIAVLRLLGLGILGRLGGIGVETVIVASIGSGFFYLLHVLTRGKGMGFGDVKFVFLMGLILGHPGLWIALYTAFLTGAATGVILILTGLKKLKQTIAFGPFLVFGTVAAIIWGDVIFSWWMKFMV